MQVDAEVRTPDGLRRREFIRFGADKAADDRRERLADDPFAYAAEHATLGQTRAGVIALQKAMGVEAYSFMPAEEAAERVRTYAATSDADKAALLRQWSAEAGKHRPALLRDLAAAQLPAPALLLLRHADNPRLGAVLDRTFAAASQSYRELTKDLSEEEAAALRREVAARLFGGEANDGRPGFADRAGADAGDIGAGDVGFDDDRDAAFDDLLVLAAAGADGDGRDNGPDFRLVGGADGLSIEDPETGQVVLIDPDQLDRLPELAESVAAAGDKPSDDLTREVTALVLSLLPGIGEALSARDAYQAFRAAAVAIQEGDRATALRMLRRGVFSAAGVVPVFRLGKAALRAARLLFKLGRRARFEKLERARRETKVPEHVFDAFADGEHALDIVSRLPRLTEEERHRLHEPIKNSIVETFQQHPSWKTAWIKKAEIDPNLSDGDIAIAFAELVTDKLLPISGDRKATLLLGEVEDYVAKRISDETGGFDVSGLTYEIDKDQIQHAYNEHGPEGEFRDEQEAITVEDFGIVTAVFRNFDKVKISPSLERKADLLEFQKRINGTLFMIAAVRRGRGALSFFNMWKTIPDQ